MIEIRWIQKLEYWTDTGKCNNKSGYVKQTKWGNNKRKKIIREETNDDDDAFI